MDSTSVTGGFSACDLMNMVGEGEVEEKVEGEVVGEVEGGISRVVVQALSQHLPAYIHHGGEV